MNKREGARWAGKWDSPFNFCRQVNSKAETAKRRSTWGKSHDECGKGGKQSPAEEAAVAVADPS